MGRGQELFQAWQERERAAHAYREAAIKFLGASSTPGYLPAAF